jgi:hypothetical protein
MAKLLKIKLAEELIKNRPDKCIIFNMENYLKFYITPVELTFRSFWKGSYTVTAFPNGLQYKKLQYPVYVDSEKLTNFSPEICAMIHNYNVINQIEIANLVEANEGLSKEE